MPEIPADQAVGEIRDIYEAIEAALGVRLVNLVYRHLATVPGALEWAWYTIGASFEAGIFAERSRELVADRPTPPERRISLEASGLSAIEAVQVIETLDAYNRANPMNAVSLRVIGLALEEGRPAGAFPVDPPKDGQLPALLPMASLDNMAPGTRDLMLRLARLTTGRDTKIVPSLFRHFAPWPELLSQLADAMEAMGSGGVIDAQAQSVFEKADRIAQEIYRDLPAPPEHAVLPDPEVRRTLAETIEMFPPTICRMIVIAGLLRAAIVSETAEEQTRGT